MLEWCTVPDEGAPKASLRNVATTLHLSGNKLVTSHTDIHTLIYMYATTYCQFENYVKQITINNFFISFFVAFSNTQPRSLRVACSSSDVPEDSISKQCTVVVTAEVFGFIEYTYFTCSLTHLTLSVNV